MVDIGICGWNDGNGSLSKITVGKKMLTAPDKKVVSKDSFPISKLSEMV